MVISLTSYLGKYLVSIIHIRVSKHIYNGSAINVQQRLAGWGRKQLFKPARVLLIRTVMVTTVPLYNMKVAKIPIQILEEIERLNRWFFWGEKLEERKLHSISWEQVCKPNDAGGLGIKRLRDINVDLLAKLGWRMLNSPITFALRSRGRNMEIRWLWLRRREMFPRCGEISWLVTRA